MDIGYVQVTTPIVNGNDSIKDGRMVAILDWENVKFLKMIHFWLQGIPKASVLHNDSFLASGDPRCGHLVRKLLYVITQKVLVRLP